MEKYVPVKLAYDRTGTTFRGILQVLHIEKSTFWTPEITETVHGVRSRISPATLKIFYISWTLTTCQGHPRWSQHGRGDGDESSSQNA
ncbi:hypothetical protein TNIN_363851 [Trichonephila inaurata madagascariensis]|uniref:Uncharacterized protein n=1 Tax=Trichonephila inaurata madagascariensis TaxID=2747483 RepID=A0A8X6XBS4_9ARAC|nr:hypothetical protein TNIN_363851 [Trichonephila inaurata madagascariensis]